MSSILTDSIDVVGPVRTEPPGALDGLINSIRENGLLFPLTVTANLEQPGRYILLAGRRRLAAVRRLDWKRVKCLICTPDSTKNEMIEITENFHRLDLLALERERAIVRYAELVRALELQHTGARPDTPDTPAPEAPATRAEGALARTGLRRQRKVPESPIVATIVHDLGISPRSAQRALRRADAFTDEQRDLLAEHGVRDVRLDRITAIEDPGQRALVVETIGDGVSYLDAMTGILHGGFIQGEDDLGDEAWLATLELSTKHVNQERFRSDALLYRRIQRKKIAFALDLGWEHLREEAREGATGIFYRRLAFLLECPHPRQWVKCSGCTAGIQSGHEHVACRGGGYLLG